MSFVLYGCGCIEGPVPAERCWRHGAPVKGPFTGVNPDSRGVAQRIDCPEGRPITVWVTNGKCDGAGLCPARYNNCHYKPAQKNLYEHGENRRHSKEL